ncbi:MAG: hypothetical protein QXU40_01265 [Candidatus Pacearchaeota archaeon]
MFLNINKKVIGNLIIKLANRYHYPIKFLNISLTKEWFSGNVSQTDLISLECYFNNRKDSSEVFIKAYLNENNEVTIFSSCIREDCSQKGELEKKLSDYGVFIENKISSSDRIYITRIEPNSFEGIMKFILKYFKGKEAVGFSERGEINNSFSYSLRSLL